MAVTSVRIQSDLESQIEELASKLQRSKNWLINQALREYIEKKKQGEKRWEETLLALESVKKGEGVSEEEVDIWLQSWGTKKEKKPPKK
ncbi:MAG: ribbon-helix-helix protein, CopG family [Proteobacteria bacterium]|nr:ribbon-helix-helix protein, CopG family [Pseudomonadota bacterium]